MSDQTNPELTDEELDDLPAPARTRLRQLEKENRELRPLKDENSTYKLKEELRADGMEFSNTQLKALLAAHDGEKTPSELRKTAEELKFVEPKPATEKADADAHGAIDAARAGSQSEGSGLPTYEERVEKAESIEELQAIAAEFGRAALQREV